MKRIFLFLLTFIRLYSTEYDLGEIEVKDKRELFYEKKDQVESFVKIIKIKEEDYSKTIKEILETMAGIEIKSNGGESSLTTVSIRGSGSSNVLLLIDGIPLNSSGMNNVDLSIISPSIIERIEIIRGGNSSLYGSNASGGVVNIITKKSEKDRRKIYLFFKPFSLVKTGIDLLLSKNILNFLISNGFIYDRGDFIFLNDNGTIYNKNDDFYQKRLNNTLLKIYSLSKLNIMLPQNSFLEFGINNSFNNQAIAGPKNFTQLFEKAFYQRELFIFNSYYNSKNLNKYIVFETKLNYKFDYYNYENQYETSINNREIKSYLNYFNNSIKLTFVQIPYNLLIIENNFSIETLYNSKIDFLPYRINNSIILRDEIVFYNDTIGIIPSINFSFSNDNYFYPSFNLGFFYSPKDFFKLKGNIFGAYRNPDFFELYYSYGFVLANKDLKPEKSFGFDFGFIVNMNGFFLECVTFMTYYLDLIKYILSYGYVYRPINFSSAISYGLETSFIFNPINFFKLEIAYTLNFLNDIYMLTISKFYQLPGQPLHSASFILEFLIKFFTIGFKVRIEDRININDTATKYIDPKTIIDIYLKFDFEKRLTLFVFFNNITNIYREDFRNYPLEGFNFKMGVNIEI